MAPSNSGGDRILSYHDAILHRSDLAILAGPNFINDRIISFYFTHLSLSLPTSTLLIPPSLSYFISFCSDPQSLSQILSPLHLPTKTLILFPVNDNPDPTLPEAGTHWSLLVYRRHSNRFIHHDSFHGSNRWCAERLYSAVKGFVGGDAEKSRFIEGFTPQQRNGYDCGLFVMAIARVICEWKEKGAEERWFGVLKEEVDAAKVERLRGEILSLILSLRDQK